MAACSADTNNKTGGTTESPAMEMAPLAVTATTTQICDYVTQIAEGSDGIVGLEKTGADGKTVKTVDPKNKALIKLSCLLAPNASAHEHEMTNQQMQDLAASKLMLVSGVDLEHFLDKAIDASGFSGKIIVTSGDKGAGFGAAGDKLEVVDGPEKVKVEKWPFPGEDGEDPEFTFDPHVWTSPANAKIQVVNIGAAFAAADPEHKDAYDQAVEIFGKRVDDLDAWAKATLDSVPAEKRVLFTSHDAFGYFSNRYDIKFMGSAIPDFSDLGEASADHLAETVQKIKDSGAIAVFAENSNSDKNVQKLAKEANVKLVNADDALYGDSLGPVGSAGETYIGSIIHNVKSLTTAWEGKIADLPESIKSFDRN
ncbi:metal ABC transporter substrate-binding protein [Boudabousia marimammalium]|nr:metal ABC transporter substrate-binding protein [Boudabousia marimammalium]